MENGNKISINLESGIDVKSSDMLVPVGRPRFAHNRQRWQGHVLPNSLRYERNGWAAGWNVYAFDFVQDYVFSEDNRYALSSLQINNNPMYIVRMHEVVDSQKQEVSSIVVGSFKYNKQLSAMSRDVKDLDYSIVNAHDIQLKFYFNNKYEDNCVMSLSDDCTSATVSFNNSSFSGSVSEPLVDNSGNTTLIVNDTADIIHMSTDNIVLPSSITSWAGLYADDATKSDELRQKIFYTPCVFADFSDYGSTFKNGYTWKSDVSDISTDDGQSLSVTRYDVMSYANKYTGSNSPVYTTVLPYTYTSTSKFNYDRYICIFKDIYIDRVSNTVASQAPADLIFNNYDVTIDAGSNNIAISNGLDISIVASVDDNTESLTYTLSKYIGIDIQDTFDDSTESLSFDISNIPEIQDLALDISFDEYTEDATCEIIGEVDSAVGALVGNVQFPIWAGLDVDMRSANELIESGTITYAKNTASPEYIDELLLCTIDVENVTPQGTAGYKVPEGYGSSEIIDESLLTEVEKKYSEGISIKVYAKNATAFPEYFEHNDTVIPDVPTMPYKNRSLAKQMIGQQKYTNYVDSFLASINVLRFACFEQDAYTISDTFSIYNYDSGWRIDMSASVLNNVEVGLGVAKLWQDVYNNLGVYLYTYLPDLRVVVTCKYNNETVVDAPATVAFEGSKVSASMRKGGTRLLLHKPASELEAIDNKALIVLRRSEPNNPWIIDTDAFIRTAKYSSIFNLNISDKETATLFRYNSTFASYSTDIFRAVHSGVYTCLNSDNGHICLAFSSSTLIPFKLMYNKNTAIENIKNNVNIKAFTLEKLPVMPYAVSHNISVDDYFIGDVDYTPLYDNNIDIKLISARYVSNDADNTGNLLLSFCLVSTDRDIYVYYGKSLSRANFVPGLLFSGNQMDNKAGLYATKLMSSVSSSGVTTYNAALSFNLSGNTIDYLSINDVAVSLDKQLFIEDHIFFKYAINTLLSHKRNVNNHVFLKGNNYRSWSITDDFKISAATYIMQYVYKEYAADATLYDVYDKATIERVITFNINGANGTFTIDTGTLPLHYGVFELSAYFDNAQSLSITDKAGFVIQFEYMLKYLLCTSDIFSPYSTEMLGNSNILRISDSSIYSAYANDDRVRTNINYVNDTVICEYTNNDITLRLPIDTPYIVHRSFNVSEISSLNLPSITYDSMSVKFDRAPDAKINIVLPIVFNADKPVSYDINSKLLSFDEHIFDLSKFDTVNNWLDIKCVDIRNPDTFTNDNEDMKYIERIDCSKEKQFLRQTWDTQVSTENFWWVDSDHILKLTDYKLILLEKDGHEYDDWQADKWNVSRHSWLRTKYITSKVKRYGCTNASGDRAYAYFYTIEVLSKTAFKIMLYDTLNYNNDGSMQYTECVVSFIKRNITKEGEILNVYGNSFDTDNVKLCSYSDIMANVLTSEAKFTATAIFRGGRPYVIFGIHYDNNFNQWSLLIDTNIGQSSQGVKVYHGYGYVGANGSLTGGQLPIDYFKNNMFTGAVCDLSCLDTSNTHLVTNVADIGYLTEKVVGNENQQWYLNKKLSGIVSHLTLDESGASFTPQILPITNNYAYIYESPSFVTRSSGGISISANDLRSIFPSAGDYDWLFETILVIMGYPLIYSIAPKISTINYLQQTLGQYAFVHYNTTSIKQQKSNVTNDNDTDNVFNNDKYSVDLSPVDSDDISFDIQHIPQEQSVGDNPWEKLFYQLGAAAISALDYKIENVVANTHQNQSAVSDKGKKYSQMFLKNIESMSSTEFTVQSLTPILKSEVTAVKTLDMFYSTSAGQHVEAGPGFVAHNFVAQCVAQSVTSVQLESQQMSMMLILKALTLFQLKIEYRIAELVAESLKSDAEAQAGTPFLMFGFVEGSSYGWIVSLVLNAAYLTATLAMSSLKVAIDIIDPMLDALGARQLQTNITAKQSKHTYDIEAKHRYGSKHETFMWPCFNCTDKVYKDEIVVASTQSKPWHISIDPCNSAFDMFTNIKSSKPSTNTISPDSEVIDRCIGDIDYRIASCYGKATQEKLPNDMAYIIGTESFMPEEVFKNENISESEPVFASPVIQDFVISKEYDLFMTCTAGEIAWVGCKDTKLIDGAPSNIVMSGSFCGVASSYTAIEVRNGIDKAYIRPWAITPNALALNQTGKNVMYDEQAYHGFDGIGYRITDWLGAAGMNKEHYTLQYAFQINDRFKRSNKLPPNQFFGNFEYDPSMSVDTFDEICSIVTVPSKNIGLNAGTVGEDKDVIRYAIPIFSEFVSTLPAVVKTAQSYKLAVIDGITSLTTDLRNTQTAYKTPVSYDFILGTQLYRATNEYICRIDTSNGAVVVTNLVPTLGMIYIGATPHEAFFYSQATRQYYSYAGGTDIRLVDMLERFRDITAGRWDFVNQDVILSCLATFDRLDNNVKDDTDETDNIMILSLRNTDVKREVTPPNRAIFKALPKGGYDKTINADSSTDMGFRILSLPAGLTYQGPNRCIINRYTWSEYMLDQIKNNKGKWVKVPREIYHPFREYPQTYTNVYTDIEEGVHGWTHNPFLLVTAPLGISEEIDCKYEWEITFAWTVEMDKLYSQKEYVCVNICSELMTQGGKMITRPTHVFLTKDLFTRTGNYGYYSFRYQGNGGIGNRERLHIWSDGYIAVSGLQLEIKQMTSKRTEILTQQLDVQCMQEF